MRKNYRKGFDYVFQSVQKKEADMALTKLGYLYKCGIGVKRDYEKAVALYRKAAEQQYAPAFLCLGICYINGKGVPQDLKLAFKYTLKSARLGNAGAMFNMGLFYKEVKDVKRTDYAKAVKWFIKSFKKDANSRTALRIGELYEKGGPGLKPDLKEAEKWYEIAKDEKALVQMETENPSKISQYLD